jgi:thymidylate kinase
MRPLVIALEGPSGAGKTTVARGAGRTFGWEVLPEAYSRLVPTPSLAFAGTAELLTLEEALLAEERRRYRRALAARRQGRTVLADTGFFGPITYTAGLVALGLAPRRVLDRLMAAAGGTDGSGPVGVPDAVVYLDVPERVLRRRVASDPTGHPEALALRHLAVAQFERSLYLGGLRAALAGRVVVVPGSGAPAAVARRMEVAVRGLPLDGRRRGARERVLAEVRTAVATFGRERPRTSAATVKKPARSARAPPR